MVKSKLFSLFASHWWKFLFFLREKPQKLSDAEETLRQERLKKLAKPRVDINKDEEKKQKAAKLEKQEKAKQPKLPKVLT